jgi:hypothetical protein
MLFQAGYAEGPTISPWFGLGQLTGTFPLYNYNYDTNNINIVNNAGQYATVLGNSTYGTAGAALRFIIGNIPPGVSVTFQGYSNLWFNYYAAPGGYQGFRGLFGTNWAGPPIGVGLSSNSQINFNQVYFPTFILEAGSGTYLNTTTGSAPGYGLDFAQPLFAPINVTGSYHTTGINVATTRSYNSDWWG